jgi:putative two-component system response regulator
VNGKILVVDDDPAVRKVLGIGLTTSGYETRAAASGAEALEILHGGEFRPDCVLTDIRMPGMPGDRLLEMMRQELPLVPVIMLTALNQVETAVDTMRKGAFDYLLKPVRKAHLEETVRKALRFRDLQLENERLLRENEEYQRSLERKVEERTAELHRAYLKLQQANLETVKVLAETIEAKDPYTRGHCNRVRQFSARIASAAALPAAEAETLEYGALLHDIGKIGVPEALLNKSGRLEEQERQAFQFHPVLGAGILREVELFRPCLPIVRSHHEHFDGSGYPDGLSGEGIDLKARIVAVADAFDAMTSTRPYRPAMAVDTALRELHTGRGTQFDPRVVELFIGKELYRA